MKIKLVCQPAAGSRYFGTKEDYLRQMIVEVEPGTPFSKIFPKVCAYGLAPYSEDEKMVVDRYKEEGFFSEDGVVYFVLSWHEGRTLRLMRAPWKRGF